jgi:hypothetical protein
MIGEHLLNDRSVRLMRSLLQRVVTLGLVIGAAGCEGGLIASGGMGSWDRIDSAEFQNFLESTHENDIVKYEEPIRTRVVEGTVLPVFGEWPEDTVVVFEVRGPEPEKTVNGVVVRRDGRFAIRALPPGRYMFKATARDWRLVVAGRIIVSDDAPADAKVAIVVPYTASR